MEFIANINLFGDVIKFEDYALQRVFKSKAHFDSCNFTESAAVGFEHKEKFDGNSCYDTGSDFLGHVYNCTSGVKFEVKWVLKLCDSVTFNVSTDGGAFVENVNNWVNVTSSVKPPITVPITSKIKFIQLKRTI